MSGAWIDGVTAQSEIESEDAAALKKQMINLASHMAPASGVARALEYAAARLSGEACCTVTRACLCVFLKCQRLSAAPCRDMYLIDVTFYRWCSSCRAETQAGRESAREQSAVISWCVMTGSLKAKPFTRRTCSAARFDGRSVGCRLC